MRALYWLQIGMEIAREYHSASQCIEHYKRLGQVYRDIGNTYVSFLEETSIEIPGEELDILSDYVRVATEALEDFQRDFSFAYPPDLSDVANAIKDVAVAAIYLCQTYVPSSGVKSFSVDAKRGMIIVNDRDRFSFR